MWEIIEAFNKYNTLLIVTNATCQKIERQNIEIPELPPKRSSALQLESQG